eukprot:TRINITY_DN23331_c0_g1_i1.p3 TRINITY_DN23331_c0_g1~~TRINITY_DN23331_c0_g1_i1.p3  ORF type:complete len:123 (+),score=29.04 TRINITY_DN23331_c0_g1_i1:318-686(+)
MRRHSLMHINVSSPQSGAPPQPPGMQSVPALPAIVSPRTAESLKPPGRTKLVLSAPGRLAAGVPELNETADKAGLTGGFVFVSPGGQPLRASDRGSPVSNSSPRLIPLVPPPMQTGVSPSRP